MAVGTEDESKGRRMLAFRQR